MKYMVEKFRNKKIKCLSIVLCLFVIMNLLFINVDSFAAKSKTPKLKLSKTSVSVVKGKSVKVNVKGSYKKIKLVASKKGYVKASVKGKKITIKGVKAGTISLTVKGYNKNGKLAATGKIKVKIKKKASGSTTTEQKTTEQKTTEQKTTEQSTTEQQSTTENGKPSAETTKYDAGDYSISKVHSGEATYYDLSGGGAANLDDFGTTYLTAAMNNEDYMNGLAGAYIEVTDKDGDKVKVLITDRLPEGKKGDIDLTRKAFKKIEPEVTGRMKITWKIIPLPTDEPISFLWKQTSTQYWAEIQVRNGRYPIKSLEYLDKSTNKYKKLERQEYNYFTAPSGLGAGPYTFRITDFYGHVIVENNVAISTTGKPVKGTKNFPY